MTNSSPHPDAGRNLDLADIIGLLGHRQWSSIMQKEIGAAHVVNHHVTPGIVPALVNALAPSDVWYGVNELQQAPAGNRRATEQTVARWCAVWADLDIKTGGCPTEEVANQIIDDITAVYGGPPTYIVRSGHGLQPVWVIHPDDAAAHLDGHPERRAAAVALLKRHGRMVQAAAIRRGAKADSVFDLPRVLRAPGTTNHKDPAHPKPTSAIHGGGHPITTAVIRAALDAAGIGEMPSDVAIGSPVVAAPSTWKPRSGVDQRCGYAETMVNEWAGENPAARHPWLVAQATRIAAARRHGCFTHTDAASAERELAARFYSLCARGGDARAVGHTEIDAAMRYGQDLVATMSDDRVATELGRHEHIDVAARDDQLDRMASTLDQLRTTTPASKTMPKPDTRQVNTPTPAGLLPPIDDEPAPDATTTAAVSPAALPVVVDPVTVYTDTVEQIEQGYEFWTCRPSLNTIWRAAIASEASPWAVLAIVMLRVIAATPHDVYLPGLGTRGPTGSLNLFAGIAGRSGAGKGLAAGVAGELYRHSSIFDAPPGSGEGIGHLFGQMARDKETKRHEFQWARRSVLIDAPEVDALGAIGGRKGSTADAILRQGFSGETLGFSYATVEKRLRIPRGEYRLTMMVGVQPERAGAIFDAAAGGTPQRFMWVPAEDHRLGIETADWDGTPIADVYKPEWWADGHVMEVCDEAMDEIRADRRRRGRHVSIIPRDHDDDDQGDALDAHAMYAREKVAAALAILDGRDHINADDWWLSGAVAGISLLVRDGITQVMENARLRDARDRGAEKGAEMVGAKETASELDDKALAATMKRVVGLLRDADEPMMRSAIHQRLSKAQRLHLSKALGALEESGLVAAEEVATTATGGRPGVLYRAGSE